MTNHPVVTPVVDITAAGSLLLYWIGVLTPVLALIATVMTIAVHGYNIYKTFLEKKPKTVGVKKRPRKSTR